MSIGFLKKISEGKIDEHVHKKLVRYSKGEFEREELKVKFGSKIQMWAGFEYIDVFFQIAAQIVEQEVSLKGVIQAKENLEKDLLDFGIKVLNIKKGAGPIKHEINATLSPLDFKKFVLKFSDAYLLLNLKSGDIEIKTKTSLPKPGALAEKIVSMKLPKKYEALIREDLCFGSKDPEVTIKHKYIISDVEIPKQYENDPAMARLMAKRKGKVVIWVNGTPREYKLE